MLRISPVVMLAAAFLVVTAAAPAANAVTPQEQQILVKKKKLAAEQRKKAEAARKLQARKAALAKMKKQKEKDRILTASGRKCTGFMRCLFGTKRGVRVERNRLFQTTSFAGTRSISSRKTRRTIDWSETRYAPGSIIIRTPERALYYVLGDGKALRYAVGVGKEGMQWSGQNVVSRKTEWPSWTPPETMIKREAAKGNIIPAFMEGGPGNPLGARAIYIGSTIYRVHGTNNEASIGGAVSSGCIRMMNADVIDLYDRVKIGSRIYVYQ